MMELFCTIGRAALVFSVALVAGFVAAGLQYHLAKDES